MTSTEPSNGSEGPLRAMSIARFIPRFTKPRLLTSDIPTYRHSFSPPIDQGKDKSASSVQSEPSANPDQQSATESAEYEEQARSASYVEWNKFLPVPSNLLGSFQDLFEPRSRFEDCTKEESQDGQQDNVGTAFAASASPPPRLVFFGEQHHQPEVMRAQLQTLHALHQQCQQASKLQSQPNADSSASPTYHLHLILEHFSVLDQSMLNSFSRGHVGPDELAQTYQSQSEEAFYIGHYMPLLMLARELNVPIWGGFPPRSWARQVFRDGVESVKAYEEQRVATSRTVDVSSSGTNVEQEQGSSSQNIAATIPLRSPLFTSWGTVTKIGAAHRSYLSGLMRPDMPPRFPQLPDQAASKHQSPAHEAARHSPLYPTWLLKPHNIETKGFGPAQALKDSYLAHVTTWILRGAGQDTSSKGFTDQESSNPAPVPTKEATAPSTIKAGESDRPIVNVALVVCGLGHCEYGFGAPERVVQLLSQDGASSDDTTTLFPYIIASKPLDSGIWLGYEHSLQLAAVDSTATDNQGSIQSHQASQLVESSTLEQPQASPDAVQRWLSDPWGRKMADAVLLYDWMDDEPNDEVQANADGHQPTST